MGSGRSHKGELSAGARRRRSAQRWRALFICGLVLSPHGVVPMERLGYTVVGSDTATAQVGSETMRVIFETTSTGVGYFPGLAKPVVIETDQLSEADARELEELVAAARVFDRPAQGGGRPAPGAADYRQYTITIEQGTQRQTVNVTEPIDDPAIRDLVRFLEAKARELRSKARPGSKP